MDPRKPDKKNIFYGRASLQAFRQNRLVAPSVEAYHIGVRQLKEKLNPFREMHLQYCCHMMQGIFCMVGNKVHVNKNVDDFLKSKVIDHAMLVFVLKLGCLMNCVAILGKNNFFSSLAYDAQLYWDKSVLNTLLKKLLASISAAQISIPVVNFHFSQLLNQGDQAAHSGTFYRRVLSVLCQLVRLRLCDPSCENQHNMLDLGIVSCAMIMGTMYKQYISMLHFSGDVEGHPSFSQVVTCMGPQRPHRGVFARLCVTIIV
ncbi:DUF3514 domain-containing protein [Ehrlichia canis]|uniref:DUF3514 domain-containing protein n=1 Tax=Ehrlichia canis TaxID=944 RepID=UPI000C851248|nr:DUF3514 domain-containing protein [Ehrlichia canis]AUO54372.1 hypothetical protein C1I72_00375 [Ehrlichia canis]UKC53444.1 DUF3514 domain-containing protein [Ehrlichia canis]UKC54380.1 DUF3514 domain-containing protein [Ehrlichia canis]UKC55317.1 DUF3514 domain-containing protein [Ehrlichia canis]